MPRASVSLLINWSIAEKSPASAQDGLENGEIIDSDGGDESDSGNSSTSSSDNDSVRGTPSAAPRRSARIAQQSGVGQQPPAPPTSLPSSLFSLNMAEGFPIVSASRCTR